MDAPNSRDRCLPVFPPSDDPSPSEHQPPCLPFPPTQFLCQLWCMHKWWSLGIAIAHLPQDTRHTGLTAQRKCSINIFFICNCEVPSFYRAFLKSVLLVPVFFKGYPNASNRGDSRSQWGSGCVHCPWFRQCCTGFPTIWKPGSQNRLTLEPGFKSTEVVLRWGMDPSSGGQSEGREHRYRACQQRSGVGLGQGFLILCNSSNGEPLYWHENQWQAKLLEKNSSSQQTTFPLSAESAKYFQRTKQHFRNMNRMFL